jgi:hypothetical protein
MSRLSKLKRDHIKKVNELLDEGEGVIKVEKEVVLYPSSNVTSNPPSFVNKMNRLKLNEGLSSFLITGVQSILKSKVGQELMKHTLEALTAKGKEEIDRVKNMPTEERNEYLKNLGSEISAKVSGIVDTVRKGGGSWDTDGTPEEGATEEAEDIT